jgi:hypothetical protein
MFEFLGCSSCDAISPYGSWAFFRDSVVLSLRLLKLLYFDIFGRRCRYDSINVDSRLVNVVGVNGAQRNNVFGFDNGEASGFRHDWSERFGRVSNYY